MGLLTKLANKSLLKWEARRRKDPNLPLWVGAWGAVIAGRGLMEYSKGKKGLSSSDAIDKHHAGEQLFDGKGQAAIGAAVGATALYSKTKTIQAKNMYGHLSDEELKRKLHQSQH